MKKEVSISFSIQDRKKWNTIQGIKSFDWCFNIFSASLSKYNILKSPSKNCQYSRISQVDTIGSGCQGRGCVR